VLLAANLGEDADNTAALAGQIAGAVYGASGIPADWLGKLAGRELVERRATELHETGSTPAPTPRRVEVEDKIARIEMSLATPAARSRDGRHRVVSYRTQAWSGLRRPWAPTSGPITLRLSRS
jgi:hypothetical protein